MHGLNILLFRLIPARYFRSLATEGTQEFGDFEKWDLYPREIAAIVLCKLLPSNITYCFQLSRIRRRHSIARKKNL